MKCDESQTTGESDIIRKRPADEVYAAIENREELKKMDPFIMSGSRVMEGVGTFLVSLFFRPLCYQYRFIASQPI